MLCVCVFFMTWFLLRVAIECVFCVGKGVEVQIWDIVVLFTYLAYVFYQVENLWPILYIEQHPGYVSCRPRSEIHQIPVHTI